MHPYNAQQVCRDQSGYISNPFDRTSPLSGSGWMGGIQQPHTWLVRGPRRNTSQATNHDAITFHVHKSPGTISMHNLKNTHTLKTLTKCRLILQQSKYWGLTRVIHGEVHEVWTRERISKGNHTEQAKTDQCEHLDLAHNNCASRDNKLWFKALLVDVSGVNSCELLIRKRVHAHVNNMKISQISRTKCTMAWNRSSLRKRHY